MKILISPTSLVSRLSVSFSLLLCICVPNMLQATHIVGGEMGYRCLGNDLYEIRLTIYRDCFFGNPDAYFDDPASIGVFDSDNNLLQDIRVELMGDDTLSPVLTDECLVIPPSVCVHTTTYRTTVTLPPRAGGYQLAYQRCCRNQTIANIVNPLATGATYGVVISERALQECNSSAEFLEWPPLYICANEPILFDQSAVDRDGDSIVYRLCAPLQGADQNIPRPQPPNNPPYAEVVWRAVYGVDNMLNGLPGGEPLRINSQTGLLTGTPNTVGQFVVGICAEEYRDGELISTTRRDFQYNVGICGQVNAAFFAPDIQCEDLEVAFTNLSQQTEEYLWYFDYGRDPNAFSNELNPNYTYPDTGNYTVALIAAPGTVCADTFFQEVQLLPRALYPEFSLDTLSCGDSLVVQIADHSTALHTEISDWEWSLNGEVFSNAQEPVLHLGTGGFYRVGLRLSAENGCVRDSFTAPLQLRPFTVDLTQEEWRICQGDSVSLFPDADPGFIYSWSPRELFLDPTQANPQLAPELRSEYQVQIIDPLSGCRIEREVEVIVFDTLSTTAAYSYVQCSGRQILFQTDSPQAALFEWDFGDPNAPNARGYGAMVSYTYAAAGTYEVQIRYGEGLPCETTISLPVSVAEEGPIQPAFSWDYAECTDTLVLNINDQTRGATIIDYAWYLNDSLLTNEPTFLLGLPGADAYALQLVTTAENGCRDSIRELITPRFISLNINDTLYACPEVPTPLNPDADTTFSYQWAPAVGLDDPSSANPVFTGATAMTYTVTITDTVSDCRREASLRVEIAPPIRYELLAPDSSCADEVYVSVNAEEGLMATWYADSALMNSVSNDLSWEAEVSGSTVYYIELTDEVGCRTLDSVHIEGLGGAVEIEVPALLCLGDTIRLKAELQGAYPAASFNWMPAEDIIANGDSSTPLVAPDFTSEYVVEVVNTAACTLVASVIVPVATTIPVATANPPRDTIIPGESIILRANQDPGYSYLWSPPIGLDDPTLPTPSASPEETTRYVLTITDPNGCTATDSLLLVVLNSPCRAPYLFVPTAFSPNGDLLNDELLVAGNVIDEFYLTIYDRWGEEVFSTRNQAEGWDGTFKGKALPADVYGYYLEVSCLDGQQFREKGNITLLR